MVGLRTYQHSGTILTRYKNLSLIIILGAAVSESVHWHNYELYDLKTEVRFPEEAVSFFPPQRLGHFRNQLVHLMRKLERVSVGGTKWPECKDDKSRPSNTDVKKKRAAKHTPTPTPSSPHTLHTSSLLGVDATPFHVAVLLCKT
jgi:hypothetical protein